MELDRQVVHATHGEKRVPTNHSLLPWGDQRPKCVRGALRDGVPPAQRDIDKFPRPCQGPRPKHDKNRPWRSTQDATKPEQHQGRPSDSAQGTASRAARAPLSEASRGLERGARARPEAAGHGSMSVLF